jgi:hypothetical protein
MTLDALIVRAERAIGENRLLRDERRFLEQQCSHARNALRSAVVEMSYLRAAIQANRKRRGVGGGESNPQDCEDVARPGHGRIPTRISNAGRFAWRACASDLDSDCSISRVSILATICPGVTMSPISTSSSATRFAMRRCEEGEADL